MGRRGDDTGVAVGGNAPPHSSGTDSGIQSPMTTVVMALPMGPLTQPPR